MDAADFTDASPGQICRITVDRHTEVAAFLPHPLTLECVKLSMSTAARLGRAENLLGRLDGMTDALPDPSLLTRAFVRREAAVSSYIEDTFAAYDEIGLFEFSESDDGRDVDAKEILNAERVIFYGMEAIRDRQRPITPSLLKEMHRTLLDGVSHDAAVVGAFRRKPVFIGRKSLGPIGARFVPPPDTFVEELVDQLCEFIKRPHPCATLITTALIHYQFETIHPFEDGNGRLGRALILLKLCQDGCLRMPVLNPSLYFELHRSDYYDHLLHTSQTGDWMPWVEFFIDGMIYAANDAIHRVSAIRGLLQRYKDQIRRSKMPDLMLQLVEQLFVYPRLTIATAATLLDVTPESARKYVGRLAELGILAETTGRTTNRVFVAREILETVRVDPTRR